MSKENGHPITRKDLREELKAYATRRELRRELKRYATQESLNRTQETVNRTQESVNRLARAMGNLNARVSSIEERMSTRDDINRIMKALDGLATASKQSWAKLVVHEQRIKALERR